MLSNLQLIKNYGMDINDCKNNDILSPFDLIQTLAVRDSLEEEYYNLSGQEQMLLREYDENLLACAHDFYYELSKVYNFNTERPLSHWWAHIDKVVSGYLIVDLYLHQAYLKKDNELAATVTA